MIDFRNTPEDKVKTIPYGLDEILYLNIYTKNKVNTNDITKIHNLDLNIISKWEIKSKSLKG